LGWGIGTARGGVFIMSVVRCPRCRDEVTLPAKASSKALVRCPLCLEEYLLAEALAHAPPTLLVIGGEESGAVAPGAQQVDDGYQLTGGGFSAGILDASAPATAAAMPARPVLRSGGRPRKKEKNPIVEAIKVVLGGVVGLSLGLLILWWVLGMDVDMGPVVAKYVPSIVPARFRGQPAVNTAAGPAEQSPQPKTTRTPSQPDGSRANEPALPLPDDLVPPLEREPASAKTQARPKGKTRSALASEDGELQLLPPLGGLPRAEKPLEIGGLTIDDPLAITKSAAKPEPKSENTKSVEETLASPAPPMPDLRDLLPDGPAPAAAPAGDAPPVNRSP
jgi:hypothetical protein